MKKIWKWTALLTTLLLLFTGVSVTLTALAVSAAANRERKSVIVGGELVGIRLKTRGVLVVGTDAFASGGQDVSPAQEAGLQKGDLLKTADGADVKDGASFSRLIAESEGRPLDLTYERGDETGSVTLTPRISDATGEYKSGLWVRDSAAGIGTLTYTDPETGTVAALGHGIYDADTGGILTISDGVITDASFTYVVKGEIGAPGEIGGTIGDLTLGDVDTNADDGIYGTTSVSEGEPIVYETAFAGEIHTGPAQILCTVSNDGKALYDAQITRICDRKGATKNMIVKVTDEALLAVTGGIVQGMSGAPVIQDGRLIGAVTHVFVNDPKCGYGIFIENMLRR